MKRTAYAFVSQSTGRHTAISGSLKCSTTKCISSGKYRDSVTVRMSLAKFRRPLALTESGVGCDPPQVGEPGDQDVLSRRSSAHACPWGLGPPSSNLCELPSPTRGPRPTNWCGYAPMDRGFVSTSRSHDL